MDSSTLTTADVRQLALLQLGDGLRGMEDVAAIVAAAARTCGESLAVRRAGYGVVDPLGATVQIASDWRAGPQVSSVAGDYRFADYGSYFDDLRGGEVVAIADVAVDPRTSSQRAAFGALQIVALLNVPLMRDGVLAGIFLAHHDSPRAWSAEDIKFVRGVADRTWAAIAAAEAHAALRALNAMLEREVAQRTADRNRIWRLSKEIMLVAEFGGEIVAVNPAAESMLGWSARELVGRSFFDLVHADDLQRTRSAVRSIEAGMEVPDVENRYQHRDGSHRSISWSASQGDGLIIAAGRDVTEHNRQAESLRQVEDQLRQSQKLEAIGQLTGGIAHDFNNLLTIISTSIQLLQRPDVTEDRRQRFMGSISNAVSRASKLTGQLLAFARRQTLQPVVFDAAENVRAVGDMLRTLLGARIELTIESGTEPCLIDADPGQFDTALVNMAANARDAMDGAGQLAIRTTTVPSIPAPGGRDELTGPFVAVAVTDTGSGIEADRIERVFEPFYTTKAVGRGTGLGLSQVFGFAKQSGGDVQVESLVGCGTTFTLYLPQAVRPSAAGAAADLLSAADAGAASGRLLVVEDNLDVAAATEATLTELGYEVTLVHDAASALKALADDAGRFSAVFCDVMMAHMDGLALARRIRERHPSLPILLCSGYSSVLAESDGFGFPLLAKPYSLEVLQKSLRDVIAGSSLMSMRRALAGASPEVREKARLTDLDALHVLDTPAEQVYDEWTQLAATLFDAPIALVSLVDEHRQWFKSRHGLEAAQTPREHAFCAHAIANPAQVMVVPDAARDPRFANNPLVTGDPNIRFYAGAPLVTSWGHAIGTICVIDTVPREPDPQRLEALQVLADRIVAQLESRRSSPDA